MMKWWISCVLFSQGGHCRSGLALNKHHTQKSTKVLVWEESGTASCMPIISPGGLGGAPAYGICIFRFSTWACWRLFPACGQIRARYGWLASVGVPWFSIKMSFTAGKKQIYTGRKQVIMELLVTDEDCMRPFPASAQPVDGRQLSQVVFKIQTIQLKELLVWVSLKVVGPLCLNIRLLVKASYLLYMNSSCKS